MININITGTHDIPGRGTIFVADQRENSFNLSLLRENSLISVNGTSYRVRHLETLVNNHGIAPVIGILVKGKVCAK